MESETDIMTQKIIGCAYAVGNTLGHGFLEKVYENAMAYELSKHGLHIHTQLPIQVFYDGKVVGDYVADICVESQVLVEIKAVQSLTNVHVAQCVNYLKATGYVVCLLLNFGSPRVQVKRVVV